MLRIWDKNFNGLIRDLLQFSTKPTLNILQQNRILKLFHATLRMLLSTSDA
jgi:hypothetical protein